MAITIDAIHENGVLRPVQPLELAEHERVRLTLEPQVPQAPEPASTDESLEPSPLSLVERITALAAEVPSEVVRSWPTDGASQHDHSLYGTPRRTE